MRAMNLVSWITVNTREAQIGGSFYPFLVATLCPFRAGLSTRDCKNPDGSNNSAKFGKWVRPLVMTLIVPITLTQRVREIFGLANHIIGSFPVIRSTGTHSFAIWPDVPALEQHIETVTDTNGIPNSVFPTSVHMHVQGISNRITSLSIVKALQQSVDIGEQMVVAAFPDSHDPREGKFWIEFHGDCSETSVVAALDKYALTDKFVSAKKHSRSPGGIALATLADTINKGHVALQAAGRKPPRNMPTPAGKAPIKGTYAQAASKGISPPSASRSKASDTTVSSISDKSGVGLSREEIIKLVEQEVARRRSEESKEFEDFKKSQIKQNNATNAHLGRIDTELITTTSKLLDSSRQLQLMENRFMAMHADTQNGLRQILSVLGSHNGTPHGVISNGGIQESIPFTALTESINTNQSLTGAPSAHSHFQRSSEEDTSILLSSADIIGGSSQGAPAGAGPSQVPSTPTRKLSQPTPPPFLLAAEDRALYSSQQATQLVSASATEAEDFVRTRPDMEQPHSKAARSDPTLAAPPEVYCFSQEEMNRVVLSVGSDTAISGPEISYVPFVPRVNPLLQECLVAGPSTIFNKGSDGRLYPLSAHREGNLGLFLRGYRGLKGTIVAATGPPGVDRNPQQWEVQVRAGLDNYGFLVAHGHVIDYNEHRTEPMALINTANNAWREEGALIRGNVELRRSGSAAYYVLLHDLDATYVDIELIVTAYGNRRTFPIPDYVLRDHGSARYDSLQNLLPAVGTPNPIADTFESVQIVAAGQGLPENPVVAKLNQLVVWRMVGDVHVGLNLQATNIFSRLKRITDRATFTEYFMINAKFLLTIRAHQLQQKCVTIANGWCGIHAVALMEGAISPTVERQKAIVAGLTQYVLRIKEKAIERSAQYGARDAYRFKEFINAYISFGQNGDRGVPPVHWPTALLLQMLSATPIICWTEHARLNVCYATMYQQTDNAYTHAQLIAAPYARSFHIKLAGNHYVPVHPVEVEVDTLNSLAMRLADRSYAEAHEGILTDDDEDEPDPHG